MKGFRPILFIVENCENRDVLFNRNYSWSASYNMEHKVSLPPISDILRSPLAGHNQLPPPPALRPPLSHRSFTQAYPLSPYQAQYQRQAPAYHYSVQTPPHYMPYRSNSLSHIPTTPSSSAHNNNLQPSPLSLPSVSPRLLCWKLPLPTYELKSIAGFGGSTPRRSSHADLSMITGAKRKTRNNLPKETTFILLKWLNEHLHHPYPNSFEKNHLMAATGLNQQQLSNWFINARRRKIKLLKEHRPVEEA